jgi:GT2 family glycosyltransferase
MMMRKPLFEELGGFDEAFSTMYQDLDLCLRLRERGLRIIWTPQALLIHDESMSRSKYYDAGDRQLLLDRWQKIIKRGDPYYNRNLDLEHGDYGSKG